VAENVCERWLERGQDGFGRSGKDGLGTRKLCRNKACFSHGRIVFMLGRRYLGMPLKRRWTPAELQKRRNYKKAERAQAYCSEIYRLLHSEPGTITDFNIFLQQKGFWSQLESRIGAPQDIEGLYLWARNLANNYLENMHEEPRKALTQKDERQVFAVLRAFSSPIMEAKLRGRI
jgi:hypothetical protein